MRHPPIDYAASTALVTGATSGIGRAIAHELAGRGVAELILVARDAEALAAAAADIAGPRVDIVAADLAAADGPARVFEGATASGRAVDLLVNDAGIGTEGAFPHDGNDAGAGPGDVVRLNVGALVGLSGLFLPPMVERGAGGILNVGSTAGLTVMPYSAAYGASKAFVIAFSQALREENRESGVRVACVVPGVTRTNLGGEGQGERRGALENVDVKPPQEVAKVAFDALEANAAARIVGLANRTLAAATGLLPDTAAARAIGAFKDG